MTFCLHAQEDGQKDGKAKKKVGHWCLAPKKQGRKSRMKQQGLKKGMGHNLGPRWYKEKNMIINFSSGWMT
jgi:hypothetical protein